LLTKEENDELTRVGAGTPGGELLRRYWHPIAVAEQLTPERPKKRIRLLGEDLVLFRDQAGKHGLVREECPHRGASLLYGFLDDGNIRCAYHGWMYDKTGRCVEQPFEPAQSMLKHTVRIPAYPVEKVHGLLFAYLGPLPAPLIPPWDVLAREDGTRKLAVHPVLEANWLQVQETNLDPTHNTFLHQRVRAVNEGQPWSFVPIEELDFEVCEWGIVKRREFGGDDPYREEGHPALFPNVLRHSAPYNGSIDIYWRTPLDDTHTQSFWMSFKPSADGSVVEENDDPPVDYPLMKDDEGFFHMQSTPSQDSMAWETQGPLRDRSRERLGASDKGVVLWRQLLKEQIEKVKRGEDPMGVIRAPTHEIIHFALER